MSELKPVMKRRATEKVLADPSSPLPAGEEPRARIDELLAHAANAPFHYQATKDHRAQLTSPVPWRMYKLDATNCRNLLRHLINQTETGIIRDMLAAADWLVLATWTPDADPASDMSPRELELFAGSARNMEHIAAAGAAIQNFLLLATEGGWSTYWSSGGVLRSDEVFGLCDIPDREILLGAVFLFPAEAPDVERRPGKLRDARGAVDDWSRWVEVGQRL